MFTPLLRFYNKYIFFDLTTGKAGPQSERTEVQCADEVVGGRQAETGTKKNRVPLELPIPIISYIISISLRLPRKYLDIQ